MIKKRVGTLLLGLSLVVPSIPSFAAQSIEMSKWALPEVAEGEKYGIYPMQWYEESLKNPIDKLKVEKLCEGVEKKLEQAQLIDEDKVMAIDGITKKDVITGLYSQLEQCTDVMDKLNPQKLNAVDYFKTKGYIQGTKSGLELEKKCSVEEAILLATRFLKDTYEALGLGAKGLGYKIVNGNNTVYLLGSVHLGSDEMYPVNQNLKKAFDASEALFVEADILSSNKGLDEYLAKAKYEDGTSLKEHISGETYEKTVKALEKYNLPTSAYEQFKPWCIANDLTNFALTDAQEDQDLGTSSILGVDRYFLEKAYFNGKPVEELEGLSYQADLFNGLSKDLQESYLAESADVALNSEEMSTTDSNLVLAMQDYWCNGDYENFVSRYSSAMGNSNDEFANMLLGKRDKDMADKLTKLLEKEGNHTYFVVIGVAHVLMPDMVVDKLKEKGYSVERFQ